MGMNLAVAPVGQPPVPAGSQRPGQVVLELLDAAGGDVAGTRRGDVDGRDRARVDDSRSRRARAGAVGVRDGHRRGGRVAGADGVDADADHVDGRRRRGAGAGVVDGVRYGAVIDGDAGRRRVAGAGVVDDDAGDGAVGVLGHVSRGLDTGWVVGHVEADGRVGITRAGVRHRDCVDAAVSGGRSGSGRAAAGECHDGLRVVGAVGADRDGRDSAAVGDDGRCGSSCAGAGDGHRRCPRVPGAGVGHCDTGDGAIAADRCRGLRARTGAGDGHCGIGQRERAQGPVRPWAEVVGDAWDIDRWCGLALRHLDHEQRGE